MSETVTAAFDPAKHPRHPAGSDQGGEWAPKTIDFGAALDQIPIGGAEKVGGIAEVRRLAPLDPYDRQGGRKPGHDYQIWSADMSAPAGEPRGYAQFTGTKDEVAARLQESLAEAQAGNEFWRIGEPRGGFKTPMTRGTSTLSLNKVPNAWAVEQGYADYVKRPRSMAGGPADGWTIRWKPDVDPERVLVHWYGGVEPPPNFEPGTPGYEQFSYGTPRGTKGVTNKAKRQAEVERIMALQSALVAAGFVFEPLLAEQSMVCLYPQEHEQEALAAGGGQDADSLHVTLALLPESVDDPEAVASALADLALWIQPLNGQVGGLGMFQEGNDGVPMVALPDVVGLNELRAAVVDRLSDLGVGVADEHGRGPHITLAYGPNQDVTAEMIGVPLTFDHVTLVVGAERWDLPLGAAVAAAARHDCPYCAPDEPCALHAAGAFVEAQHPRHPRGSDQGGEFAPKGVPSGWGLGRDYRFKREHEVGRPGGVEQVNRNLAESEIMHGAIDTQHLYAGSLYGYSTGRVVETQNPIIQHFIGDHQPSSDPTTLFMAGGSGAGKSSILQELSDDVLPPDAVMVNSDLVKERLPEYKQLQDIGSQTASSMVHEESSDVSKRMLNQVNGRRMNAIVDGTGDSAPGKFMGKIQQQIDAGRKVRVVMVDIPTDEAIRRSDQRFEEGKKTGNPRWVPHTEIVANHKGVAVNHLDWRDKVDDWEVWANDDGPGGRRVIAHRVNGGPIEVLDSDRYQQALAKAYS